ncbi:MAG: putative C-S lyase [Coriobacteriales bacterium]|nr:putative C-S lyase [Coriobacteriales bacterium]
MNREPAQRDTHGADLARLRSLTCAKWTWYGSDVLPAWVADMDFAPAPVVVDAVRALVDRGDFGYNFSAECQLASAFVEWQERRHGWTPDPRKLRTFCDVMQGVELALWLHTQPGDGVVVLTPIYPPFIKAVERSGRRMIDCPLDPDGWRLDRELLESLVDDKTTAILLCNPHNPTGRVFDADELGAIADVAERVDALVISDEVWGDVVFPGSKHLPFAALREGTAERTVTVTSAAKAFNLAGLRCAMAHFGHKGVRKRLHELPEHALGAVGSLAAEASLAAWTGGASWLEGTLAQLLARRDRLARWLAEELPEARYLEPQATYLAWLDLRALDLGADPAEVLRSKAQVALSPGPDFGKQGEGFARLNFATSAEIFEEILERLRAAI